MESVRRRQPREIASGLFLLSHPVPVLFHTLAVGVFALLASWPHFIWSVIALVVGAHTAMQLAIAVFNDYCDRYLDAMSKKQKAIPLGLIYPREALVTGTLLTVIMVLLLLPLNLLALLVSLLYFSLAQSYNFGLKSTPFSGVVFALAIPLIPLYAFVGVGHVLPSLFWLVPLGSLLGIAINLANSLPDVEEDAAQRARTLAVVLGVRRSFIACPLLILLCVCLTALLVVTSVIRAEIWILVFTLIVPSLGAGAMALFFGSDKPLWTRKIYFYLVVWTCIVLGGGWLIGVSI